MNKIISTLSNLRVELLKGHNLAIASLIITLIAIAIYAAYKIFRSFSLTLKSGFVVREHIKFNTRKITYVSMMVAVSVATTTVISLTLPVTVFPPIRIAFEGVMIKITGMIFGPVIGLTVGVVTEVLTLMFVPSYIHVAYLIVALSFGFWSGLTSYTFKLKRNGITLSLITLFLIISAGVLFWLMQGIPAGGINPKFFGISISAQFFPYLFLIMIFITLLMIYLISFVLYIKNKQSWLNTLLPIILLCVMTEILVTVIVAAWGDYQLLGISKSATKTENTFITVIVLRVVQVPFKILFNTAILTTVYTVLRPLIKVR